MAGLWPLARGTALLLVNPYGPYGQCHTTSLLTEIDCSENCSDRMSGCMHPGPIRHSAALTLNVDF
jgi:hypothetical protein